MRERGWSRRSFLRAVGLGAGAAVLSSSGRLLAQDPAPQRLMVFYTSQDLLADHWLPPAAAAGRDRALHALAPELAALEPFRDRLLQVHGVRGANGHIFGHAEALTGSPGGDPLPRAQPAHPSLDQRFALQGPGQGTPTPSLQLAGWTGRTLESVISFLPGDDGALPIALWPQRDPRVVFERVFRALSPEAAADRWQSRRSVLDHTAGELTSLRGSLGSEERVLVDQHLTSVRALERQLTMGPTARPTRACAAPSEPAPELDAPARVRAHIDLTVAAFACDLTRTSSLMVEPGQKGVRHSFLTADGVAPEDWVDWHEISHGGGSPTGRDGSPNLRHAMHRATQMWHAEQLAYLLGQLDAVPEGEGSLLDYTTVLWVSELGLTAPGQNNPHLRVDVPLMVIGGQARSGLRAGRYVNLDGEDLHYHDVLLTLAGAHGLPMSTYGESGTRTIESLLA